MEEQEQEQTYFELIHNMDQFTNQLIVQWNKSFDEDLGISDVLVLGHLKQHGKSRPSDIAKMLGFTPPTLSYLSDKLVKRKLAVRMTDESDRRIIFLEITDKGAETLKRASMEGVILRRKLFEKLTQEEREHFAFLFKKMNAED